MFRCLWLLSCTVPSLQYTCLPHNAERLLRRLDQWNSSCVDVAVRDSFDRFKERVAAQTFEEERQPLGVVLFTNASRESRVAFQRALSHAIVGSYESPNAAFLTISDVSGIHKAREQLQQQLANAVGVCPGQPKLIFVDSIEHLGSHGEYEQLSLLDVFLDPLNGIRASCVDPITRKLLDTSGSIIIFVYHYTSRGTQFVHNQWKPFLEEKWSIENQNQMEDGRRTTLLSKFTPSAFLGRVTLPLLFFPKVDDSCLFFPIQAEKFMVRSTMVRDVQILYLAIGFMGYLYLFILNDQWCPTNHGKCGRTQLFRFHSAATRICTLDGRVRQSARKRKLGRLQPIKRKIARNAKIETGIEILPNGIERARSSTHPEILLQLDLLRVRLQSDRRYFRILKDCCNIEIVDDFDTISNNEIYAKQSVSQMPQLDTQRTFSTYIDDEQLAFDTSFES
uniref:Uncharacterized protein AlNc14C294G10281 n=1 Tax=Albugo laibachii Nc14 TaxID=890382 RepID=F0WVD7_9STRA|nr:conserved hypothetical protein [Albugo laibachii Nc14]|eukprot:CCA25376.1 conserved hypothetical protein [Albugo laibachii Nc14]